MVAELSAKTAFNLGLLLLVVLRFFLRFGMVLLSMAVFVLLAHLLQD
jgi:hypothetical protein